MGGCPVGSWAEEKADDCIRRGVTCPCESCRENYVRAIRETIEEAARRVRAMLPNEHGPWTEYQAGVHDCVQVIEAMGDECATDETQRGGSHG
jgi:hypothetical protein